MNKRDVLELKRRLTKDTCTFTRMCGCYVDADGNEITKFNETFLNLESDELYKYLDITKKVLSGKIGNNVLKLNIPEEERAAGGRQQFLMGLRESKLKNEELLDRFYEIIIENYKIVPPRCVRRKSLRMVFIPHTLQGIIHQMDDQVIDTLRVLMFCYVF